MEFEINGKTYRCKKLNVFQQLHVSRKLLPMLSGVVGQLKSGGSIETTLPAIAESVSALSDADCNAVIYPCLAVVSLKQGTSWVSVFDERSQSLMFDDISLMDMLKIVAKVIGDSLGNFLHELQDVAPALDNPQ